MGGGHCCGQLRTGLMEGQVDGVETPAISQVQVGNGVGGKTA